MARVDLTRYGAVAAVTLSLLLGFALLDFSLRATFGLMPDSLMRTEYLKPDELAKLGGRVMAVEATPPARPLAILLGFSTVREAFVPSLLEAEQPAAMPRKWLNLGASGASFFELDYYVKPLLRSALKPELVVIGMHPVWMAGRVSNPKLVHAGIGDVVKTLAHGRFGELKRELIEWSFLGFNRNRVDLSLERALASGRERALLGLGLPQRLLYPPASNPWLEERRYEGRSDEKLRGIQMGAWERFHWFEPGRYRGAADEASDALSVIRACQQRAKRVVLVYMPEGDELRARMPADAESAFEREVLAHLEQRPKVIDLRDALPPSAFYDHIHVNETGRPLASALLVERLAAPD